MGRCGSCLLNLSEVRIVTPVSSPINPPLHFTSLFWSSVQRSRLKRSIISNVVVLVITKKQVYVQMCIFINLFLFTVRPQASTVVRSSVAQFAPGVAEVKSSLLPKRILSAIEHRPHQVMCLDVPPCKRMYPTTSAKQNQIENPSCQGRISSLLHMPPA